MADQADTLRRLMQNRARAEAPALTRKPTRTGDVAQPKILTIASGKGGVGKSCFSAHIGTMLARNGYRVLLVDGDFGLANLDILLNVQHSVEPVATLEQVLRGTATIQEAVVGIEPGLWLIPATSGLMDYKDADHATRENLIRMFEQCPWEMDFIIVDAGAGIQSNVLSLHDPEFESIVMLTPEPTALTDAYGLIKLLRRNSGIKRASVIVNRVTDGREGTQTFQKLKDVAARFIDVELDYLGHWQKDEKVTEAVMKRKILLDLDSGAISVPSLQLLAKRFQAKFIEGVDDTSSLSQVRAGPVSASPLRTGRFRDEPARQAPGNTAGFFRTLLGEVKA